MENKKLRKRGRPKIKNSKGKNSKKLFDIKSLKEKNKNEYNNLLVHLPIDINLIEINTSESYEQQYLNYENILNSIKQEPEPFESDDIVEERINFEKEKIEIKENIILNKKKIKKKVYNIKKKENNILCWWCCHSYENQSIGLPIKKENDLFVTIGYFCSINCTKAYNQNNNIDLKDIQYRNLLIEMLNYEMTDSSEEIISAPPKETLKIFGGTLDIDEFREKKQIIKLIYPPIITIIPYIEEITLEEKNEDIKLSKNLMKNNLLKLFK